MEEKLMSANNVISGEQGYKTEITLLNAKIKELEEKQNIANVVQKEQNAVYIQNVQKLEQRVQEKGKRFL
jgi:hypothetical protein